MFKATDFTPFEKKVWLASPTMHGEELKYMTEAYETNWMSTVGENINEVEKIAAETSGVSYAIALSSCTAALHLCVKLAGEKLYGKSQIGHGAVEGKRVFCSDMTFDATLNPVVYEGGIPVFIDTDPASWNMDPESLEKAFAMYPEVKLVVCAELYGFSGNIRKIKEICEQHGALLIEDAAEAMGASWEGKQCGAFGDYAAISYNGNKIITGSSGGCLLTNSLEDANKARKWSTQARENAAWYQHEEVGYNYRMSNVVAGIGRGQLLHLEEHKARKNEIYRQYKEAFADIEAITMNPMNPDGDANNWLSCMTIAPDCSVTPDQVMDALAEYNIETRPIWKPMHLQPVFADCDFIQVKEGRSVSEDIFNRGVCLPSDIKNTPEDMKLIISLIRKVFEK